MHAEFFFLILILLHVQTLLPPPLGTFSTQLEKKNGVKARENPLTMLVSNSLLLIIDM